MKHFNRLRVLTVVALAGLTMIGCRSNIDLDNINTSAEVTMGMALPVGTIKASIKDFIGNVQNIYVDTLNGQPVVAWKDTFSIARDYHHMDLSQYVSDIRLDLNVYENAKARHLIGDDGKIEGHGVPVTLTFDVPLKFKGINHPDSLLKERIDSARIEMASFASTIVGENLNLEWDWIDSITLDLGAQISRNDGNVMTVYTKRDPQGANYGTKINTDVDNFSLCLMKNRNLDPNNIYDIPKYTDPQNILDSCLFKINFTFTIPDGTTVTIPDNAKFDYTLGVQFIHFSAIWGMFIRSNEMINEDTIDIASSWGDLGFISRWQLPFSDPRVDLQIVTQVAGAMVLNGKYLAVVDANGQTVNATFNEEETKTDRTVAFGPNEYLDPIHSALTDSTTNMWVIFDKDPYRGHIDKLFRNMPQKLGYSFEVTFDFTKTPQIRIVPNTNINVHAITKLPLSFKQGLFIDYRDTISVDLSKVQIDSLIAQTNWVDTLKTTDVKLILKASNTIPMQVKATMRCLDENNNVVMDPTDPLKPLILFETDTIKLPTPTYSNAGGLGGWSMTAPGESTLIASMTKAKLDVLPKVKRLVYYVIADDESLKAAYAAGLTNVAISDKAGISLKIGLTAQVDAVLNFGNNNQ